MKKVMAMLMVGLLIFAGSKAAQSDPVFGTSANLTVNCTVSNVFGFSVESNNLTMNFTVNDTTPNPEAQTLEILASNNQSQDWMIQVSVDRFVAGIDSPFIYAVLPQDGAANGYTNAQGTAGQGNAPLTNQTIYDSATNETGTDILVALNVRPLGMASAPAGSYSTTVAITMVAG